MNKYIPIFLRVFISVVLIQTLRFKFLGHPDSIYIFTKVGMEPYGRIGLGIVELISGILILVPRTIWIGAGLSAGILFGAILMHLTLLGIEVKEDQGTLFYTAIVTFLASFFILWHYRNTIPFIKATKQ